MQAFESTERSALTRSSPKHCGKRKTTHHSTCIIGSHRIGSETEKTEARKIDERVGRS